MNAIKDLIKSGRTVVGTAGAPNVDVSILADAGYDFLLFDTQHSPWEIKQLQPSIQAMRGKQAAPVVRVAGNEADQICFALDAGARGIVVPMVNTRAEAEAGARLPLLSPWEPQQRRRARRVGRVQELPRLHEPLGRPGRAGATTAAGWSWKRPAARLPTVRIDVPLGGRVGHSSSSILSGPQGRSGGGNAVAGTRRRGGGDQQRTGLCGGAAGEPRKSSIPGISGLVRR